MASSSPNSTQKRYRGRLARRMLLVLMPLALIPLIVIGSMAYLYGRNFLQQQASSVLATVVETQGKRIESQVETGQLLLSRALARGDLVEALDSILANKGMAPTEFAEARTTAINELQSVNRPKPFFNQFLLVDRGGNILLSTKSEWQGQQITDPKFLEMLNQTPVSTAGYAFSPMYAGEVDKINTFVITTVVAYQDRPGGEGAYLVGISESVPIQEFILNALFYSDQGYFVTQDGEFIALNPYTSSFSKLVLLEATETQRQAYLKDLPSVEPVSKEMDVSVQVHNQPVLVAQTWLESLQIGWAVEALQANIYDQINAFLRFGVILMVVLLVLVGAAVWLLTQTLIRPVLDLTNTVQRFADGKWGQRSSIERNDELGLLADSFNQMADDLSQVYTRLETQVEERTEKLDTLAQISQITISSTNLDELLKPALRLIVESLQCENGAVYLTEESGLGVSQFAVLRQSYSSPEFGERPFRRRIMVDPSATSETLAGRVIAQNHSLVEALPAAVEVEIDKQRPGLSLFEAAIPITVGSKVLGALNLYGFGPEGDATGPFYGLIVSELQTLANHIASAVQNFQLLEASQINLEEANLLFQASHQIAQAETAYQVFDYATDALQQAPYISAILIAEGDSLQLVQRKPEDFNQSAFSDKVIPLQIADPHFPTSAPIVINDIRTSDLPDELLSLPRQMGCDTATFLPVNRAGVLTALLVLGSTPGRMATPFTAASLQPYANLIELVTITLEKIQAQKDTQKRLAELQSLWNISQAISIETDLTPLYKVIHQQVTGTLGELDSFGIGIFDSQTNLFHFPYMVEDGETLEIAPFPLGKGLSSIVIHTRKPLRLVEDTEAKAQELGALYAGAPAKSWLGVPLLFAGEPLGIIIVQDLQREHRFDEEAERLLVTLASQVAVVVRNARLLETARRQAELEKLINKISGKIRRSVDIQSILKTTVDELAGVLNASRATIELQNITAEKPLPLEPGNGRPKDQITLEDSGV